MQSRRFAALAISAALLIVLLTACASAPKPVQTKFPIVSYIRTWPLGSTPQDMQAKGFWTAAQVHGELLSTLNISFAQIKDKTQLFMPDAEDHKAADGSVTKGFAKVWDEVAAVQKRFPHLKVNLSIGGWGAEGFSEMSNDDTLRAAFVKNVADWVQKYKLSGIDIDWEYPVGPEWGQEIKSSPNDRQGYVKLLTDLRSALDRLGKASNTHYGLSTAVPASPWFLEKNDVKAVAQIVDYLKIMGYDYYGGWSETTGHASNLYNNPKDPAWGGWSTDQAITAYLNGGIPASKMLLGVPFYAHAWQGVPAANDGLFQKPKGVIYPDGLSWTDIKANFLDKSGFKRYWDDTAKAPYLYNGDVWITYEDPEALKYKVDYVKQKGLAGIMIWEYGHDVDADLLGALVKLAQ